MKKENVICVEAGGLETDIISTGNKNSLSLDDIQIEKVRLPEFASMVLEEEAAADMEEDNYAKLRERGYFSPVRGMVSIQNALNNSLYAKIHTEKDGMRQIVYCQRYKSGEFSQMMSLSQADMMLASKYKFLSKDIQESAIRSRVSRFVLNAIGDYNGKFSGESEDCLEVIDIMNVLYAIMPKLPVDQDETDELSAEEFYRQVEHHVQDIEAYTIFPHKSYYKLDESGIEKLAHLMGMRKKELLGNLKKHGFLYLTKSSRGYQTNARFPGNDGKKFTEWVYCIYKLKFFAGIAETEKENETFDF